MSDRLRITANGMRFEGWKAHRVTRSLEHGVSTIEIDIAEWPLNAERLHLEDEIRVDIVDPDSLSPARVFTGHIETLDEDEDADGFTSKLSGRSLTCALVDCDANLGSHRSLSILDLARRLAEPFGVNVLADVDVGEVIPNHRVQPGEKVFDCIERVTRRRGLMVTDTPSGELLLTAASSAVASGAIVVGQNAKTVRRRLSVAERFSDYRIVGSRVVFKPPYADSVVVDATAKAIDPGVRRPRSMTMTGESDIEHASAQTRVLVEAARRLGQGVRHTYSVVGWRQWDGTLWQPNQLVQVTDDRMGYLAQEFLIVEVTYELSDAGTLTMITVAPRVAFERPTEAIVIPAGLEGVWGTRGARTQLPKAKTTRRPWRGVPFK